MVRDIILIDRTVCCPFPGIFSCNLNVNFSVTRCIPKDRIDDVCSEEEIDCIAKLFVGKNYVHFGLELGLRLKEIHHIEKERSKCVDRILEIIRQAGEHFPEKVVTVKAVATALHRIQEGFHDFVEMINHVHIGKRMGNWWWFQFRYW